MPALVYHSILSIPLGYLFLTLARQEKTTSQCTSGSGFAFLFVAHYVLVILCQVKGSHKSHCFNVQPTRATFSYLVARSRHLYFNQGIGAALYIRAEHTHPCTRTHGQPRPLADPDIHSFLHKSTL